MQENELILAELRTISSWAAMNKKVTKWSLIFLAIFIPSMIVLGTLLEKNLGKEVKGIRTREEETWYDVNWSISNGSPSEAIRIGEKLISRTPLYPEGHRALGHAYLAAGKVEKALEHFAEAFRLLPSKENEELVDALEKRMKSDNRM